MGYLFAILSAISWAIGTIALKKSNHNLSPHVLNLYKNLLGFFTLLIILVICSATTDNQFWIISRESVLLIILSGIVGSGLADQIYIRSLSLVGANFISVIASSLAIFILFFSFFLNFIFPAFFPKQIWPPHLFEIIGFTFIVFAIIYSSWEPNSYKNISLKTVLLALSAFMFMGLSANLTNSAIHLNTGDSLNILMIILIRFIPAIIFQLSLLLISKAKTSDFSALLNLNKGTFFLVSLGSLMLSLIAIVFWVVGMKIEINNVTLFSLLAQTSNIMIFISSWLILKETITNRKILNRTFFRNISSQYFEIIWKEKQCSHNQHDE